MMKQIIYQKKLLPCQEINKNKLTIKEKNIIKNKREKLKGKSIVKKERSKNINSSTKIYKE